MIPARRRLAALAALSLSLLALGVGRASALAVTDPVRIDLRVLLLSADGGEPSYDLWRATLDRAGVPYDAIVAATDPPVTAETLAEGTSHARYQAIVLATGNLVYYDGAGWFSALAPEEWTALRAYESAFGIRQVSGFVYPGPEYGLEYPSAAGDVGGESATVTPAGTAFFPYLVGGVPIDPGSWGYTTTPIDAVAFQTLVSRGGSPMVGVYTHPEDGREELVVTVDTNRWMLQGQLLASGLLRWVTRGVYLGYERAYLGLHIDDVFLGDDRWDMVTNSTPEGDGAPQVRMLGADVGRAITWQQQSGLRLDMVFNGEGAGPRDPLTRQLLRGKHSFGWINHTFTHPNLDSASQATIEDEILRNVTFAARQSLPGFDSQELVTGEHSGLTNPAMPAALENTGIRWIASDASRTPQQAPLGPALTLPRFPTNVYYNVGTRDEQLDEYNYVFYEACVPTPTTTCFTQPATWEQYVDNEAKQIVRHILTNDPRPHYVHQSNLAEDGTFYPVFDEAVGRYRAYINAPLVQLRQSEAAQALTRAKAWADAFAAGQVTAYLEGATLVVQGPAGLEVPLTGTSVGDEYAGARSGWQRLDTGQLVLARPAAVAPAALSPTIAVVSKPTDPVARAEPGLSAAGLANSRLAADAASAAARTAEDGASSVNGHHTP